MNRWMVQEAEDNCRSISGIANLTDAWIVAKRDEENMSTEVHDSYLSQEAAQMAANAMNVRDTPAIWCGTGGTKQEHMTAAGLEADHSDGCNGGALVMLAPHATTEQIDTWYDFDDALHADEWAVLGLANDTQLEAEMP